MTGIRKKSRRVGVIGLWALAAWGMVGFGTSAQAAGLLIADGGFGGVLKIEEHSVDVTINNGIAVTEVTQVFRNTEKRQVEALYTFPVPRKASVANFSMWINGKEMVGEVVEKKRAREIYESYKKTRRDPGLLEQKDYKTFEMRIFPINAGARQKVRVRYYQELDTDHDWATYVYPLSTSTRPDVDAGVNGRFAFNLQTRSAIPIAKVQSPSHGEEFVVAQDSDNYFIASLEKAGADALTKDIVIAYKTVRPHTGVDVITSKEKGDDGYVCLTLTVGDELSKQAVGMDYVFVLDISGSMGRDGKLDLSQNSIASFVKTLGPKDRFDLLTFNVSTKALFGNLIAMNAGRMAQAENHLATISAGGGTMLQPAMEVAYRYASPDRTLNVVILSDGMTEQRERRALVRMVGKRPTDTRVFCIGVGNDVNKPLLRQIAEGTGGLAAFISKGDDFERQAKAFRRKLQHPVATNLTFEFKGVDVYDMVPRKLPNLYHGTPVRVYARYRKGGLAKISVRGDIRGRTFAQGAKVELPAVDADNPEIERMWAWEKTQSLLNQHRKGTGANVLNQIVNLGETYSIVTEYTSFIVLENDGEYKRWKIERRNVARMARDNRSQEMRLAQFRNIRNKAINNIGPAAATRDSQHQNVAGTRTLPQPDTFASRQTPSTPRQGQPAAAKPKRTRSRRRGFDIDGGGGGALDPITVILGLGLAGMGLAATRRKRNGQK
jgi:Ca-activated chloride channel homolog